MFNHTITPIQEATLEEQTLTIPEVAKRLGVDRSTIVRWIKNTDAFPKAFKQNPYLETSPYLIPLSDVEHFEEVRHGSNRSS